MPGTMEDGGGTMMADVFPLLVRGDSEFLPFNNNKNNKKSLS